MTSKEIVELVINALSEDYKYTQPKEVPIKPSEPTVKNVKPYFPNLYKAMLEATNMTTEPTEVCEQIIKAFNSSLPATEKCVTTNTSILNNIKLWNYLNTYTKEVPRKYIYMYLTFCEISSYMQIATGIPRLSMTYMYTHNEFYLIMPKLTKLQEKKFNVAYLTLNTFWPSNCGYKLCSITRDNVVNTQNEYLADTHGIYFPIGSSNAEINEITKCIRPIPLLGEMFIPFEEVVDFISNDLEIEKQRIKYHICNDNTINYVITNIEKDTAKRAISLFKALIDRASIKTKLVFSWLVTGASEYVSMESEIDYSPVHPRTYNEVKEVELDTEQFLEVANNLQKNPKVKVRNLRNIYSTIEKYINKYIGIGYKDSTYFYTDDTFYFVLKFVKTKELDPIIKLAAENILSIWEQNIKDLKFAIIYESDITSICDLKNYGTYLPVICYNLLWCKAYNTPGPKLWLFANYYDIPGYIRHILSIDESQLSCDFSEDHIVCTFSDINKRQVTDVEQTFSLLIAGWNSTTKFLSLVYSIKGEDHKTTISTKLGLGFVKERKKEVKTGLNNNKIAPNELKLDMEALKENTLLYRKHLADAETHRLNIGNEIIQYISNRLETPESWISFSLIGKSPLEVQVYNIAYDKKDVVKQLFDDITKMYRDVNLTIKLSCVVRHDLTITN